jgi:fatty-acyl-CoA synthase
MSVPPTETLDAVLARQARLRPDAIALQFEGSRLTYGQLAGRCEQLAGHLWHALGLREGGRLAWLGANHPGQLMLLFALARIGAILLPLNFRLAPPELQAQLRDCGARLLVHDAAWAELAKEVGSPDGLALHAIDPMLSGASSGSAPEQLGRPSSPVLLVYTSGTTGGAKAAVHTHANLLANMQIASAVQEMTPADVIATMLPLFHVGGLCIQTLPALHAGASVILHARFAADAAFDCFERERPSLTLQVPATMKALLDHPRWDATELSSLRAVWAGSSLLPSRLVQGFHARGVPVCNVYGATETGPFSIALPPAHARDHVGSCGWPAPSVQARIANEANSVGELLIRGPNVANRYWPELPVCDEQGWFHSGDLASQAADGSFSIVGRAKDLIISGGENIHPAEIESVLAEHPAVAECAAFAIADEKWGEAVAAAVVLAPGYRASELELSAYLEGRLARFKRPRRWLWLSSLPKTALGKVRRNVLAQLAAGNG